MSDASTTNFASGVASGIFTSIGLSDVLLGSVVGGLVYAAFSTEPVLMRIFRALLSMLTGYLLTPAIASWLNFVHPGALALLCAAFSLILLKKTDVWVKSATFQDLWNFFTKRGQ